MPYNPVDPKSISEVVEYEEAKEMVQAFVDNNKATFEAYFNLQDILAQKREAADKVVRAQGVSVSDWDLYQYSTKINEDALFNALGMDDFLSIGGTVETKTKYIIGKTAIEAAIARKEISDELAAEVVTKVPYYHAPKGDK